MGKFAAFSWASVASVVAIGVLLDLPVRIRAITSGPGASDAWTVLVGSAVALAAAALAWVGARRASRGELGAWHALPAATAAAGALRAVILTERVSTWPFWTAATLSPMGIWMLPPAVIIAGILVASIQAIDVLQRGPRAAVRR